MTTITGTSAADSLALKTDNKNATLDQTTFLKLMTTQLKTQDPFDPVDNTQMVAQMAQFSSTTGIAEMNASLKTIVASLGDSRIGDAASWIGKGALVPSTTAGALGDGSFRGEVTLDKASSATVVNLVDANGGIVHSENIGAQDAGTFEFAWDGKDVNGAAVAGPLRVQVNAMTSAGDVTASVATWTGVTGVQSPAGGSSAKLITPIGTFAPTDIERLG